jgi:hypothetical protein
MQDFMPEPGRLMDQVREVLRFYHFTCSTAMFYVHWIRQFSA